MPVAGVRTGIRRSSALEAAKITLNVAQNVAGLTPLIGTQLESLFKLAGGIVSKIEHTHVNWVSNQELAKRVCETMYTISIALGDARVYNAPQLGNDLHKVQMVITKIGAHVDKYLSRGSFDRFLGSTADADTNKTYCMELDNALKQFHFSSTIETRLGITELKNKLDISVEQIMKAIIAIRGNDGGLARCLNESAESDGHSRPTDRAIPDFNMRNDSPLRSNHRRMDENFAHHHHHESRPTPGFHIGHNPSAQYYQGRPTDEPEHYGSGDERSSCSCCDCFHAPRRARSARRPERAYANPHPNDRRPPSPQGWPFVIPVAHDRSHQGSPPGGFRCPAMGDYSPPASSRSSSGPDSPPPATPTSLEPIKFPVPEPYQHPPSKDVPETHP